MFDSTAGCLIWMIGIAYDSEKSRLTFFFFFFPAGEKWKFPSLLSAGTALSLPLAPQRAKPRFSNNKKKYCVLLIP